MMYNANFPNMVFHLTTFPEIGREEWDELFERSNTKTLYYHYLYLRSAETSPRSVRPDQVIAGYRNNRLVLAQPFQIRETRLGRMLSFFKFPTSDHIQPLVDEQEGTEVMDTFWDFIAKHIRPDMLEGISLSQEFFAFLKTKLPAKQIAVVKTSPCLYLPLPDSMEAFWDLYRSNFRSQLRKKLRKAEETGIEFRVVEAGAMPEGYSFEQALEILTTLHQKRFDAKGQKTHFLDPVIQNFHTHLCTTTHFEAPFVTFTEARFEGRIIGSVYGFQTPHRYAFYQIGFDPEFSNIGLGNSLLFYTMEHLIRKGVKVFDFKGGTEEYKSRWTQETDWNTTALIPLTMKGRIMTEQILWKDLVRRKGKLQGTLSWLKRER